MRVHISKYDVAALRKHALESQEMGDDGEHFAEESQGFFSEDELEAIQEAWGGTAEDFLMEVFAAWEGKGAAQVLETLRAMLAELDLELTFELGDDDDDEDDDDDDD